MTEKDKLFTVKHTSVGTGTDPTILRDWVSRGFVEPADNFGPVGSDVPDLAGGCVDVAGFCTDTATGASFEVEPHGFAELTFKEL